MSGRRAKSFFYAVSKCKSGSKGIGIYTNWHACQREVLHVSASVYVGTETIEEAQAQLLTVGINNPPVFHLDKVISVSEFRAKFPKYGKPHKGMHEAQEYRSLRML